MTDNTLLGLGREQEGGKGRSMEKDKFIAFYKNDSEQSPLNSGDRVEICSWLLCRSDRWDMYVLNKDTNSRQDAEDFIRNNEPAKPATTEGMPPEARMTYENLHDPFIHARNEMVIQHVKRAIRLSSDQDLDPEFLAKNTAHEIIRLFY